MESAYDRKFQEMKGYIPFLDKMIKRLESTNTLSSNPRQAQLDKIRSLRDLLLDKKKRMKMENLLKCEQVLVNLYAKVQQQGDDVSDTKPAKTTEVRNDKDLKAARNKLQEITKIRSKTNNDDTLPEIARASQIEEVCTPGSKEPALFQRRPNKLSPQRDSSVASDKSKNATTSKRNYTRVLLSPEPSVRRKPSESATEESLFNIRSPRRSPRRNSPTYHKKERKKSTKESKSRNPEDLNITLQVPEEKLESFKTPDILSRIMNCSDRDVDIDTLRDLRSHILGELKQTGSNEDISDYILQYYKKDKDKKLNTKNTNDIEEGELSDSESEAIEKVYGSLAVEDKDKNQLKTKTAADKRKVQINLTINSDKEKPAQEIDNFDLTGSDPIEASPKPKEIISLDSDESSSPIKKVQAKRNMSTGQKGLKAKVTTKGDIITIDDDDKTKSTKDSDVDDPVIICDDFPISKLPNKVGSPAKMNQPPPKVTDPDSFDFLPTLKQLEQSEKVAEDSVQTKNIANFYKPINDANKVKTKSDDKSVPFKDNKLEINPEIIKESDTSSQDNSSQSVSVPQSISTSSQEINISSPSKSTSSQEINISSQSISTSSREINISSQSISTSSQEINILSQEISTSSQSIPTSQESIKSIDVEKTSVVDESSSAPAKPKEVSEIDILQALKNEILGETLPIATPEADTPALHQPKLIKVSSAKEILSKKRISIENYKQKSVTTSNAKKLFVKERIDDARDKKQSLKLTKKEWERLLPPSARLSLDDEQFSDDDLLEDIDPKSPDDFYSDLAPKSPDNEVITSSVSAPVIIPTDPVKTVATSSRVDVDMRALPPLPVPPPIIMPLVSPLLDGPLIDMTRAVIDPRMRKDGGPSKASPNTFAVNSEIIPGPPMFPPFMTPNYTPSSAPNMTPRQMTPNLRSFEMTPSQSSFESEDSMARKHVYAPTFSAFDRETSVPRDSVFRDNMGHSGGNDDRRAQRDDRAWDDRNVRATSVNRDSSRYRYDKYQDPRSARYQDSRHDQYVDRREKYLDSRHDQSDLRRDKYPDSGSDKYREINTDRYDKYHVDRREYSKPEETPPFGWLDCPSTPSSAFGRKDPPLTPSHPFGRSECPTTPIHPFGRSDCPTTPVHPFGRSDCPTTPSHPFGRSDCPTTPVHPFGRSDGPTTPSHPFGRAEAPKPANPSFRKDPRLNRRTEVESRPQVNERERGFPGERQYIQGSFLNSTHSSSDNSDRDQNIGHQSRYYDRERREPSQRDTENDRFNSKADYRNVSRDDIGPKRSSYGQQGVARSAHDDKSRNYRAASVGRRTSDASASASDSDNRLSIKSRSGRSFVIDTSVNNTFQKLIESKGMEVFDYSFSDRRQRAASVGRSLVRENSVGRQIPRLTDSNETKYDRMKRASSVGRDLKNERMKRASSVGRDLLTSDKHKSLRDLKAEFQAFKATIHLKDPSTRNKTERNPKPREPKQEPVKNDNRNSRRDSFPQHGRKSNEAAKPSYSPRKNSRDPRMRRDHRDTHNKSRSGSDSRDRHQYGIVYSNDNIAKGTIMGSGFGVRNYKIPKIKRPEPEPVPEPEPTPAPVVVKIVPEVIKKAPEKKPSNEEFKPVKKEQKLEKVVKKDQDKSKNKIASETTKITETLVESPKRLTRSSKKVEAVSKQVEMASKGKKHKKAVIYDSESDSDKDASEKAQSNSKKVDSPKKSKSTGKTEMTAASDDKSEKDADTISQSSFAIDDISLFPDTIVSDPVIDNINALIADLDHDIDEKSVSPTAIEKMMESIDSPEDSFGDISEVIQNDLNESEQLKKVESNNENQQSADAIFDELKKDNSKEKSVKPLDKRVSDKEQTQNSEQNSSVMNSENIVSTTDNHLESLKTIDDSNDSNINKIAKTDQTVPDSTHKIESLYKPEEGLADSTNENSNQSSAIVTSTEGSEMGNQEESLEPSSSQKELSQMDNSIGSLLSILQNKSKLKEILSMLGDQSGDSDKIKKKLEKLSEIVSDDEDSNDAVCHSDTASNIKAPEVERSAVNLSSANNEIVELEKKHESQSTKMDIDVSKNEDQNTNEDKIDKDVKEISTETVDPKATSATDEPISQNAEIEVESKTKEVEIDNVEISKPKEVANAEENSKPKVVPSDINNKSKEIASEDDDNFEDETEPILEGTKSNKPLAKVGKKKVTRNFKGKMKAKKVLGKKQQGILTTVVKPVATKLKTRSRELKRLHDDIKEMFISDDVLNATGIRMCRLAKLVEDKTKEDDSTQDEFQTPVVVLEKFKVKNTDELPLKIRKKPGPKPKKKENLSVESDKTAFKMEKPKEAPKNKPGPKSRKLVQSDPYEFDTDSLADSSTTKGSENESESDDDTSLASSSQSFGSSEVLADIKKKKRKRRRWRVGVIRTKQRKKREQKPDIEEELHPTPVTIPDFNCFTDKTYSFKKNVKSYDCRLCHYTGDEIVKHYRKDHSHTEIPLSRIEKGEAKDAIKQCEELNFQVISKMSSEKYTCRFCYKVFKNTRGNVLENFFWHVVSTHTGEYKQTCYECVTETRCPFNLDIPPPPKELQKQLIGYICGKCNFTQISLENLKTHVIVRHNDEETEVYTINLSVISKKSIAAMLKRSQIADKPRVLRSNRSTQSATEASDDASIMTESEQNEDVPLHTLVDKPEAKPFKSKLFFESDDVNVDAEIKVERLEHEVEAITHYDDGNKPQAEPEPEPLPAKPRYNTDNIMDCAHFRVHFTDSGTKEYVCCINDNIHYKTGLLISLKRHVQSKHSDYNWDGYCSLCKVIVTLQGVKSNFKDCLDHYLSKHSDDFPVAESLPFEKPATPPPKPYISVRPLAELIAKELNKPESEQPSVGIELPVIDTVVSLENSNVPVPTSTIVDSSLSTLRIATPPIGIPALITRMSPSTIPVPSLSPLSSRVATPPVAPPTYPMPVTEVAEPKPFEYEEVQADVMSKKYRIVLEAMMAKNELVRVFKCAGRFCSFTSDSAEDALHHASAHKRVGGEDTLRCAYCNFDASENAIDLVSHVFKEHACCEYCCGLCFYRAVSVQLVAEHFGKMHGSSGATVTVLRNSTLPPFHPENICILTREQAVPYYICKINDGSCKFRSYIPGKFSEHAAQKHSTATSHPCYMCETSMPSCAELIDHMKGHGLRLYQCTWCVFGASDDSTLIGHIASVHPNRLPQAYLRIITIKDGSTDMRVLPLVNLNKSKITAEDTTPSDVKENPVKVAERSVDLEKLIGQANLLANPTAETDETEVSEPPKTPTQEDVLPKDPETPTIPTISIKTEPEQEKKTFEENTVICLDSEEEEEPVEQPEKMPEKPKTPPPEPVPSTSTPNTTNAKDTDPKYRKIPDTTITKCPFCLVSFKSKMGLSRHFKQCKFKHNDPIKCPHIPCTEVVDNLPALYQHYEYDHSMLASASKCFVCQICQMKFENAGQVRTHFKSAHDVDKVIMNASLQDDGTCLFSVVPSKDDAQRAVKRKSSTETAKKGPEPQKRFQPDTPKKYGVNDIDKLPITPILDSLVYCDLCEFSTKVRLNMIRHLQLHAANQSVPQTEPVNPVPHLETNEKHFDKMVNLASSSVVTRAPEKTKDGNPTVSLLIPPQAASQYPKYVPERQRHTCGAKGCTYISVDESMLRCHWDTLHANSTDYHCVHCPPHQHLDTSKPLTAAHIIAHLKMHDVTLYACSTCTYYHYKKQAVEKHLSEQHRGGQVIVVREEYVPTPPVASPSTVAPTMDLKPWQCGLCEFKSMLRPEVVNHCGKNHQSKMQFKCGYCPFRTSTIENVSKHQSNSHPGKAEDIFYYFYKEGSIPNDDAIPFWQKQTQKTSTEVKSEPEPEISPQIPTPQPQSSTPVVAVDLNRVKKEVEDAPSGQVMSLEDLCKKFGAFCPPNGIKYRCCLCSVVMEHTREDMQSHLFEELSYRRWSCAVCSYKAYHRTGLNEHMTSHHPRKYLEPTQLPTDYNIEKWVSLFLDHQQSIIEQNKENFAKQKIIMEKPAPVVKNVVETPKSRTCSNAELEQVFGNFGTPVNGQYCCPKCSWQVKDETEMRNHLESELTKIRWCCNNCSLKFQTYHEAQYHCKSHVGQSARPIEAIRDPTVRSSWVTEVIKSQKKSINIAEPSTSEKNEEENSLLVELYAETANLDEQGLVMRKRLAESDDETLKTSEPLNKKPNDRSCPYCNFKHKFPAQLREHLLKHYQLKPFTCGHCDFVSNRKKVLLHMESQHPTLPKRVRPTKIPDMHPKQYLTKSDTQQKIDEAKKVCFTCEKYFTNKESQSHMHGTEKPEFGSLGDRVIKCNLCLAVMPVNMNRLHDHFKDNHRNLSLDYSFATLLVNTRFTIQCDICNLKFQSANDVRAHHVAVHNTMPLKYSPIPNTAKESESLKRKLDDSLKRVAKKSTTKLPFNTVAKKSTTKLPYFYLQDSDEEYTYYGTKPEPFSNFKNITTKMPMFNTVVDIDVYKFSTLLNIDPKVVVSDIKQNKK